MTRSSFKNICGSLLRIRRPYFSFSDSDIMLALESRNFDRTASEFLSRERKKLV